MNPNNRLTGIIDAIGPLNKENIESYMQQYNARNPQPIAQPLDIDMEFSPILDKEYIDEYMKQLRENEPQPTEAESSDPIFDIDEILANAHKAREQKAKEDAQKEDDDTIESLRNLYEPKEPEPVKEEKPQPQPQPQVEEPKKEEPLPMREKITTKTISPPPRTPQQKAAPNRGWNFVLGTATGIFGRIASAADTVKNWFRPSAKEIAEHVMTQDSLNKTKREYQDAVTQANKVSEHNQKLFSNNILVPKPDNTFMVRYDDYLKEDFKKAGVIIDVERINAREGFYTGYMLYKGMSLEEIASNDPKYDMQKNECIGEAHGLLMKATDAVYGAGQKAYDEAVSDFDKNFDKKKFAQEYMDDMSTKERDKLLKNALDKKIEAAIAAQREDSPNRLEYNRTLDREKFRNDYISQMTSEDRANLRKDAFDPVIEAALRNERGLVGVNARNKARSEAMATSPDVMNFKETYLAMGTAIGNVKLPVNSMNDMREITKNYSQIHTLTNMTVDYEQNFKKFQARSSNKTHGLNEKNVEFVTNITKYVGAYANSAKYCVEYAASDGFSDISKTDPQKFPFARMSEKLLTDIAKDMKGKQSFSQIPPGKGDEILEKQGKYAGEVMQNTMSGMDVKNPHMETVNNLNTYNLVGLNLPVKSNEAPSIPTSGRR